MPLHWAIPLRHFLFGAIVAVGVGHAARVAADQRSPPVALLPQYQQECASCHVAYPPGMLPAASWRRVIDSLSRHYGTDASVDPATAKELASWLTANAATYKRVREQPPQDRITRSAWFERKHRELDAAVWQRTAVGSRANCMACHTRADRGDFDDDRVRIAK